MQAFRGGRPGAAQTRIIIALTQPQSQSGGRDARPGWFFLTRVYRRTAPPSMRRPSGTGRCCGTPNGCDVHIHRSGAQIGTNYASVCLPSCLMTILTRVAQWRAYFEIRKRRDWVFPRKVDALSFIRTSLLPSLLPSVWKATSVTTHLPVPFANVGGRAATTHNVIVSH